MEVVADKPVMACHSPMLELVHLPIVLLLQEVIAHLVYFEIDASNIPN